MSGKGAASPSKTQAAPSASFVTQAASGMLTTNQPSVTGVRPSSSRPSRASSTIPLLSDSVEALRTQWLHDPVLDVRRVRGLEDAKLLEPQALPELVKQRSA